MLKDDCPDTGCGIKVYWREVFLRLPFFTSMHRYMPALFQTYGYEVAYVPVNDRPRQAGVSKYNNLNRALVGLYDLVGVTWLRRRTRVPASSTAPGAHARGRHRRAPEASERRRRAGQRRRQELNRRAQHTAAGRPRHMDHLHNLVALLSQWWVSTPVSEKAWLGVGFAAQLMFSMRFIVQWIASERARRSIVPETFWYFSLFGGAMLFAYAIYRIDPVFMLGQAMGLVIYSRNIYFIRTHA